MNIIHVSVYEPVITGSKASKATIYCKLANCPLRDRGECINRNMLSYCPYGKTKVEEGYTKNARKNYMPWVQKAKEDASNHPKLQPASERIAFIGDYVWLPYAHINHVDGKEIGLKFLSYSGAFMGLGSPFMPKAEFTVDTIVKLITFSPQALFGGAIERSDETAKFVKDLHDVAPELYQQAAEVLPFIAKYVEGFSSEFAISELKSLDFCGFVLYKDRKGMFYPSTGNLELTIDKGDLLLGINGSDCRLSFKPDGNEIVTVIDDAKVIKLRRQIEKRR